MTIDFRPNPAYSRPHWRPPAFGGPFSLERSKRFRDNRDEAYLSTEPPRAQAPSRFPRPQGDRRRPQGPRRPPRPRPQEAVGLTATGAPPVRTLSKRSEFLAANRGLRFPMPGFVLLVHPRGDDDAGMGVGYTVSKRVGNAVTRNRMKRAAARALPRRAARIGDRGGEPCADRPAGQQRHRLRRPRRAAGHGAGARREEAGEMNDCPLPLFPRHPGLDPGSRFATSPSGTPDQVRGDDGKTGFANEVVQFSGLFA